MIRIRIVTSPGNWETRTVDSVTYASADGFMSFQISGFTVSEPYEEDTISKTVTITSCTISNDNKLTKQNHGVQLSDTVKENDWVQMKCNLVFTSNGIYRIKALNNDDIEFDTNFDVPPPSGTTQACTLTVLHILYNDELRGEVSEFPLKYGHTLNESTFGNPYFSPFVSVGSTPAIEHNVPYQSAI